MKSWKIGLLGIAVSSAISITFSIIEMKERKKKRLQKEDIEALAHEIVNETEKRNYERQKESIKVS